MYCYRMESVTSLFDKGVIALLVVNQITELPNLAIESILETSQARIVIGYLNERDVLNLPRSPRIEFLNLGEILDFDTFQDASVNYRAFSNVDFYKIVECKWTLIQNLLDRDLEWVIYNDVDCFWIRDSTDAIVNSFSMNPNFWMQIQNFSSSPDSPQLCMGYAAIRNCEESREFIKRAKLRHAQEMKLVPLTGDDDIVTMLFREDRLWGQISLLPQSTFPVGSMLNLYSSKQKFPGVQAPTPYVFHTNYVIGLKNKRLMLRIFYKISKFKAPRGLHFTPGWYFYYLLKRWRLALRIRSRISLFKL